MLKKKKFYYIVIIIATLLLCADLVFFIITRPTAAASQTFSGMPDFSQEMGTEMMEMPSAEDGTESMEMPQVHSGSGKSSADRSAGMPQMSSGSDSSGSDSSSSGFMPDMSNLPSGEASQMEGSFPEGISTPVQSQTNPLRKACIPLAVLCLLIDLVCVLRLIFLKKKEKRGRAAAAEENQADGSGSDGAEDEYAGLTEREREDLIAKKEIEESILQRKGKRRRNVITALLLALVLILLALLGSFLTGRKISVSSSVEEKVYEAAAEKGSIETDVIGGGSLISEESMDISVPGTVTITSFAVSNGDHVSEGDLIANVDKTTVLSSIAELQTMINELDGELEASASDEISDTIKASADGRIVAVYAKEGTKLSDTMYGNQALIIISLDGLLSLSFDTEDSYTIGESLTLTDSDGNTYTGRVADIDQSTVTVTVSDSGPEMGDEVTITDADGKTVTSGSLQVHSEQAIVGFTGTAESIKVKTGDTVEAGDTLMTLCDTGYEANYDTLLEERKTMEDQMTVLIKAYMTGGIYAKSDGIVTEIDEDAVVVSTGTIAMTWYGAEADQVTVSEMDTDSADGEKQKEDQDSGNTSGGNDPAQGSTGGGSTEGGSSSGSGGASPSGAAGSEETDSQEQSSVDLDAIAEILNSLSTLSDSQLNELLEKLDDDTIQVLFKMYTQAMEEKEAESGENTPVLPDGGNTGDPTGSASETGESSGKSGSTSYNISGIVSGGSSYGSVSASSAASLMGSGGASVSAADLSSAGSTGDSDDSAENFVYEETTIAVLTPDDTVTIDISVDEQDILLISEGMNAEITLDAIPGTSFTGVVASINKEGTNSGGNTKYTVTISMDREEDMLSGMNAHIKIPVSTAEDLLVIPAEAIYEEGNSVFVYTGYNEADDTLTDPVEITTGKSDGIKVEVTGGLSEGDTYYYRYGDSISINFGN